MLSIIEGYNYDIFISYRQKDNKGERWVSEFVEALRTELESTFKEDISIYFDENPHDGLLETHDVDASLKEKLKCLIFIPVISRTYCDPKAFAWEHEFRAFVEIASNEQIGLKVTLPNGNVGTRVLPVRIHELEREDIYLCESLLGGILRGVDFIYKAPGVNRPLRENEDHPKDNLNKTYYRDQINKVANAISDILTGLKHGKTEPGVPKTDIGKITDFGSKIKKALVLKKSGKRFMFLMSALAILTAGYFLFRSVSLNNNEKTIAFLPIQNTISDSSLLEASDEFNNSLYQKLGFVKNITITPDFLVKRYLENEKSPLNVNRVLKANYILSGNIMKKNKEITIWVELSKTREYKLLWRKPFTWNNNLISKNTSEIVRMIARYMEVLVSPEEEKQIDTEISGDPYVNIKILTANKELNDAWYYYNYGDKVLDSASFKTAIESYTNIIKKFPSSGLAYAKRSIAYSWDFFLTKDSSNIAKCITDIDKALAVGKDQSEKDLSEIDIAQGFYYYYCLEQNEKAFDFFEKASLKDPGNYKPLFYMAIADRRLGRWDDCRKLIQRVIHLNPREALFLTNIGMSYAFFHDFDSAIIYHEKSIDMIQSWPAGYKNKFDAMILKYGVTSEARNIIDEAIKRTGDNMIEYRILLNLYDKNYSKALDLAEKSNSENYDFPGKKYIYMARLSNALNNSENSSKFYESARLIINKTLINDPDNYNMHSLLAQAYAGLGNKKMAIQEAETAIQIAHKKNRWDEIEMRLYLAQIYTISGDYENAFPLVIYLLNNPSYFTKKLLELDPVWKPLLDQPEYRKKIK